MLLDVPTPEQAADIVAIQQLAVSYAEAVSRLSFDEAASVYAPDGVLSSPTTDDVVGPAAIADLLRTTCGEMEFLLQTVHLGLVRVGADTATARFPITEWARRKDGTGLQFLGYYEDDVVRRPEGWRFKRRLLVPRTLGRPPYFTGRVIDAESMLRPSL